MTSMRAFFAAMLFCCNAALLSAEVLLGFEGGIRLEQLFDRQALPLHSELYARPSLAAFGNSTDVSITLELRQTTENPDDPLLLTIADARFDYYPTQWLTFSVGRYAYRPGSAAFISPSSFFSRPPLEETLRQGPSATAVTELIQSTFFLPRGFIRLTIEPSRGGSPLPSPDSPWFPTKDVPESIFLRLPILFPDGVTLTRGTLRIEDDQTAAFRFADASYSAELMLYAIPGVDAQVSYFYGRDPFPNFSYETSIPKGFYEGAPFDVTVRSSAVHTHAIGLNVEGTAGRFRFFTDGSLMPVKEFFTERFYDPDNDPRSRRLPFLRVSAGGTVDFYEPSVLLFAELFHSIAFGDNEDISLPVLNSIAVAGANASLFRGVLQVSFSPVFTLYEPGAVVPLYVSLQPDDNSEFSLYTPLFLGSPDGDLGQYQNLNLIRFEARWKF